MAIEKHGKNNYTVVCDNCGFEHEESFEDWDEAREFLKTHGWKTKKIDDKWMNCCPDCRDKHDKS